LRFFRKCTEILEIFEVNIETFRVVISDPAKS